MATVRRIDLSGRRYGLLTVLGHHRTYLKKAFWLCRCDCGRETVGRGRDLGNGRKKTCGSRECRLVLWPKVERPKYRRRPERKTWEGIIRRCNDPKQRGYKNYGGRGIKVCQRWMDSFEDFLADMGPRPEGKFSIERKEVDGDYEPNNCIWLPLKDQGRNRRNSVFVTIGGDKVLLIDLCQRYGLERQVVYGRLKMGWGIEEAICIPVAKHRKKD
jgi:hypothetical protein